MCRGERIAAAVGALLFPRRCPYCGEIVSSRGRLICPGCERRLPFIRGTTCKKCGKELADIGQPLCTGCQKRGRSFACSVCLLRYDGMTAAMLAGLKYKYKKEYADTFAYLLYRYLGTEIRRIPAAAIVPVPIHGKRRRLRGYNQAEEIGRSLAAFLNHEEAELFRMGISGPALSELYFPRTGIKYRVLPDLLVRKKNTRAQKELSAMDRILNLQSAFEVSGSWIRKNGRLPETVILIDDIYTTGATLEVCTRALLSAGVKRVYGLCVCAGADV